MPRRGGRQLEEEGGTKQGQGKCKLSVIERRVA